MILSKVRVWFLYLGLAIFQCLKLVTYRKHAAFQRKTVLSVQKYFL